MAETKKLYELAKTRYFWGETQRRLESCLKEAESKGYTLDLAECRFNTPMAVSLLRSYYGKVDMINSEEVNAGLNTYLEHNCKAAKIGERTGEWVPLEYTTFTKSSLTEYLNKFDKTKKYYLKDDASLQSIELAALITLVRPSVMIDAGSHLQKIYEIIRVEWLKTRGYHEEYFEVMGNALVKRKVERGEVTVPLVGVMSEDLYVTTRVALPCEFSTKCLLRHEEFEQAAFSLIDKLTIVAEKKSKMKDFVDFRED